MTFVHKGKAHEPIHIYLHAPTLERQQAEGGSGWRRRVLHRHVAVGAAVPEGAALLLEGDEVPHSDHAVVRHVEVKQLHTGEGLEGAQLARRSGEVLGDEKAIYGEAQAEVARSTCCGEAPAEPPHSHLEGKVRQKR